MWLIFHFENFDNHPNLSRKCYVSLDSQTVEDGHSCKVSGADRRGRTSVRVMFDTALSVAARVHESEAMESTIQELRNEAALEAGPYTGKSKSFQPLHQDIKSLRQTPINAPRYAQWGPGHAKLPIFITANVPLQVDPTRLSQGHDANSFRH